MLYATAEALKRADSVPYGILEYLWSVQLKK